MAVETRSHGSQSVQVIAARRAKSPYFALSEVCKVFALVNTLHSTDRTYGISISRHNSIEKAIVERKAIERKYRTKEGSYIPMVIVEGKWRDVVGAVHRTEAQIVSPARVKEAEADLAARKPFRLGLID